MLWIDSNHDGISQPAELKHLPELGVSKIDLQYEESHRVDEFGNAFFFRSLIWDSAGKRNGRFAWDVFLKIAE
ncbi:MAG: hypothetical protein M3Y72_10780 [Acidobacteriota bacterium]|nr:hypothetical protein [Acidobacteriota bacterium]